MPRGSGGPPSKSLPSATWSSPTSCMARSTTRHPIVHGQPDILRNIGRHHRKLRPDDLVDFVNAELAYRARRMALVSQNGFAGMRGAPSRTPCDCGTRCRVETRITPPLAASFFSSASGMLRGMSLTARSPWCVATTGSVLMSMAVATSPHRKRARR